MSLDGAKYALRMSKLAAEYMMNRKLQKWLKEHAKDKGPKDTPDIVKEGLARKEISEHEADILLTMAALAEAQGSDL